MSPGQINPNPAGICTTFCLSLSAYPKVGEEFEIYPLETGLNFYKKQQLNFKYFYDEKKN